MFFSKMDVLRGRHESRPSAAEGLPRGVGVSTGVPFGCQAHLKKRIEILSATRRLADLLFGPQQ